MLTAVDGVRVGDDQTFSRLTEDVRQFDHREAFSENDILENTTRADGRKLIGVPDQNESRSGAHGAQKRFHQIQINHGSLVNDDDVFFQKTALVPAENGTFVRFIIHFQHTVDGFRFSARSLGKALCRASRRRSQRNIQSHTLKNTEDRTNDRRFTRTGTARQNKNGITYRFHDRLFLQALVTDPVFHFRLFDQKVQAVRIGKMIGHFQHIELGADIAFRFKCIP